MPLYPPATTVVADLAAHLADAVDAHDASATSVADAGSLLTATEVEAALQELALKGIGYTPHGSMGAAEPFSALTGWHSGILNANCTFTLTAAPSGTSSQLFLELLQDGTGGWTITLPASVTNKTALEAAQVTTASETTFLALWSRDGGTTWYGAWVGASSTADSDATVTFTDIITNNASTSKHGFLKKLSNVSTEYMSGTGVWSTPTGSGSGSVTTVKDEGTNLSTAVVSLDFVGAGVTATGTTAVTVTIPGGSGDVATDAIWDAAGDLAIGTGADTAAKLTVGAAGMAPMSNGTTLVSTYHPELRDFNASGATPVSFAAASTGTGVTLVGTAGWNAHGKWTTNGSINYLDVASAVSTGDFDYRARIMYCASGATVGDSFGGFRVTDSGRTAGTMLGMSGLPRHAAGAVPTIRGRTGNSATGSVLSYCDLDRLHIQRIRRTGTTYIYEISFNEGASWLQIETGTSSLDIAKVGFFFDTNSATAIELLIDWVRSF